MHKLNIIFDKFDTKIYSNFIKSALNKEFKFISIYDIPKKKGKEIFLRHDVDLSPSLCLNTALIESKFKIKSIYYFLINGEYYNVFNEENIKIIKKISKLGHYIGIHYSSKDTKSLKNKILAFENIFELKIRSICPHDVSMNSFKKNKFINEFIDPYDKFQKYDFEYISDSGMKYRKYNFFDGIEKFSKIQILCHPEIWNSKKDNLFDVIDECKKIEINYINKNFDNFKTHNLSYLKSRISGKIK